MKKTLLLISLGLTAGFMGLSEFSHADYRESDLAIYNGEPAFLLRDKDFVCSAMDPSGHRYLAVGGSPNDTQETAYAECEKHSNTCYRTGCTQVSRSRRGD
jgi:hypothetical protein